jgi:tetratricopeptide (TPR) repeat protein
VPVLEDTLKLIVTLGDRRPAPNLPRRLASLFAQLAATHDPLEASETEDLIWGLWMQHTKVDAEDTLDQATRAIAAKEWGEAETLLDDLVGAHPEYAEAWNKRATLYFLLKRDRESVADIRRTLELEPRHFGAICGFAQICLRQGDRAAAMFAFDAALRINPHLASVRAAMGQLAAEGGKTLH